ncbi:MAG: hypothetical protein KJO07_24810, partial [Deltaproteobacteria bacterium]|nr:hypothetical protein [Deltaproteobacteria bacterium]
MRARWVAVAFCLVLGCGKGDAESTVYEGTFQGEGVTLTLAKRDGKLKGAIVIDGNRLPAAAQLAGDGAKGIFKSGD